LLAISESPKMSSLISLVFFIALCSLELPLSFALPQAVKRANLSNLFPVQPVISSWTTSQASDHALPLSDDTLHPFKVAHGVTHNYTNAPDGVYSMKAHYPAGSYNFEGTPRGGFSFYAPGPDSLDMTTAKEITYGYTVLFPQGFNFVKGGKLPGLYGGDTADGSVSCAGGEKVDDCFSVRYMWRTNGIGEIYTYVPPYTDPGFEPNQALCSVPPESECNPDYGNSVGRGAFRFTPGKRNTITQRVKLNDAGKANGEMELFFEGKSVINVGGLIIRDSDQGRIRGIQFQTFFGGSDTTWSTPVDTDSYFSDFSVAITQLL